MRKLLVHGCAFALFSGLASVAAAAPANCFKFDSPDILPSASIMSEVPTEIWCYQKVESRPGDLYIYNVDGDSVKPELSMLVSSDGIITHGSMQAGNLSIHRVKAESYNPFSIPLTEPSVISAMAVEMTPELSASAVSTLRVLEDSPAEVVDVLLSPGRFSAAAANKPWRGYWFPYRNLPMGSGMSKYDAYVKSITGANPGAYSWEAANHRYHGVSWEGHCNGWAAAAVLRNEPSSPKTVNGVTFSVSDMKGILSETDYCARVAFFGSRYRGAGDNIRDISPASFHKTITYYIGSLRKLIVMDHMRTAAVDNHVISAYATNIQKTGSNTYSVTTSLTVHRYDSAKTENVGVAPTYTKTYRYSLVTDGAGNITGGSWAATSDNPDFIWVPLGIADCGSNNPRISHSHVANIMR